MNFEPAVPGGFRLFNWCALDVMGRCGAEFSCAGCSVHASCEGRAKSFAGGFLPVGDVLSIRSRSSARRFDTEMLCKAVSRTGTVYPMFQPAVHVREIQPDTSLKWVGGMDFGMRSATVMLWAQVRPVACGLGLAVPGSDREPQVASLKPSLRIEVIDELIATDTDLPKVLGMMSSRPWPKVKWLGVDPSGNQRQSQTGLSTIEVLRREGYSIRDRRVGLQEGLDVVRRHLEARDPGTEGPRDQGRMGLPSVPGSLVPLVPSLLIHPRCTGLIEALSEYHFDTGNSWSETPVKDGPDHAADALRYLVINAKGFTTIAGNY